MATINVKIHRRAGGQSSLYATRDLDLTPVSIGRDETCTIKLEDPYKHISRSHAQIEEEDGAYWLNVVSKVNPVVVKGRRSGPGTRLRLHSGDSFEIGEYEVQVTLPEMPVVDAGAVTKPPVPVARDPRSTTQTVFETDEDSAERLFNEATFFGSDEPGRPPALKKMIPLEEPAEESAPFVEEFEETFVPPKPTPKPVSKPALRPAALAAPAAPAAPGTAARAFQQFLEGAGMPQKELAAADAERMLRDCGAILRAAVEGLMMLHLARAGMRKEFGAEERAIGAMRDDNPLKRISEAREAMEFLLDSAERTGGLLDPVQAIGDAREDLRAHQSALMTGMRAAILAALRRFDPPGLERALDQGGRGFSLASRKAKLWDLFVAQQARLVQEAQDDFNKAFGRDFMEAYQAQLQRLKGGR